MLFAETMKNINDKSKKAQNYKATVKPLFLEIDYESESSDSSSSMAEKTFSDSMTTQKVQPVRIVKSQLG